jgi:hypothetical protein
LRRDKDTFKRKVEGVKNMTLKGMEEDNEVVNKMYESSVYVKCYYWLMYNYPEIHEEWEIASEPYQRKRE